MSRRSQQALPRLSFAEESHGGVGSQDGVTGLLVPPHGPAALAAAVSRLLLDHPYADTLARAGHDLVHERFCVQRMVNALQALYDEGARAVRPREVATAAG